MTSRTDVHAKANMEREWLEAIAELEQLKRNSRRELQSIAEGYSKGYSHQHQRMKRAQRDAALRYQQVTELEADVQKYRAKVYVLRKQIASLAELVAVPQRSERKVKSGDEKEEEEEEQEEGEEGGTTLKSDSEMSENRETKKNNWRSAETDQMVAIRKAVVELAKLGEEELSSMTAEPVEKKMIESLGGAGGGRAAVSLSTKEVDHLRAVFGHVDKNNSGTIDVRELLLALRKDAELADLLHLPQRIRQENGTREVFERVFQQVDEDGNREITFENFRHFIERDHLLRTDKEQNDVDDDDTKRNASSSSSSSTTTATTPPPPPPPSSSVSSVTMPGTLREREAHVAAVAAAAAVANERRIAKKKEKKMKARMLRNATMATAAAVAQQKIISHDVSEQKTSEAKQKWLRQSTVQTAAAVAHQKQISQQQSEKKLQLEVTRTKRNSIVLSAAQLAAHMAHEREREAEVEAKAEEAARTAMEMKEITVSLEEKIRRDREEKKKSEESLQEKIQELEKTISIEQDAKNSAEKQLSASVATLEQELMEAREAHEDQASVVEEKLRKAEEDQNLLAKEKEAKIASMMLQLTTTKMELEEREKKKETYFVLHGMTRTMHKWLKKREIRAFGRWRTCVIHMRSVEAELMKAKTLEQEHEKKRDQMNQSMRIKLEEKHEEITDLNTDLQLAQEKHDQVNQQLIETQMKQEYKLKEVVADLEMKQEMRVREEMTKVTSKHEKELKKQGVQSARTTKQLETDIKTLQKKFEVVQKYAAGREDQHIAEMKELRLQLEIQTKARDEARVASGEMRSMLAEQTRMLAEQTTQSAAAARAAQQQANMSTAASSFALDALKTQLQARIKELEKNNRKSNMRIGALDKQLATFREAAIKQQAKLKVERAKQKAAKRAAALKRKADKAAAAKK